MKKLVVFALAAVAAVVAATTDAGPIADPATCTEAEFRAAVTEALATNLTADTVWKRMVDYRCEQAWRRFPEARMELDATLAERGLAPRGWWYAFRTWPKCAEAAVEPSGALGFYPKTIAIARRLGVDATAYSIFSGGGTLGDLGDWLSEAVAFPEGRTYNSTVMTSQFRRCYQALALKAVKRYIRSQGKSFVTKDGVNPCEEYMIGLTTALNAPRFAGLNEWLAGLGLPGIDLSKLPSEAEIAKLKDDIFYGEKSMTDRSKVMLEVCLGVDGYNAFVREYNGEK